MKSTPRRHHRAAKRVRACSSYGETIHDRPASKACACMDKDLKLTGGLSMRQPLWTNYAHRGSIRA